MYIGHIRLSETFDESAHQLLQLVLALAERRVRQHAVIACPQLAARLEHANVSVQRCDAAPMDAYCAFHACDLAHAHDPLAAKTALLLKLTTAQPYVLTYREPNRAARDPVLRSAYRRAETVLVHSRANATAARKLCKSAPMQVAPNDSFCDPPLTYDGAQRAASEHLRIYRHVIDRGSVPDLML